jgi:hypothetical protein
MADGNALRTNWTNPAMPMASSITGDTILSSGGDPNADGNPGPNGLKDSWDNAPFSGDPQKETANTVSGLPPLPDRWEPSDNPPPPPSLQDRNPGTIDQK